MGKFDTYKIDLKGMQADSLEFDYHLDNQYFESLDSAEVHKGDVNVTLMIKKTSHAFDFTLHLEGNVIVPCDRCLDDMEQPIESDESFVVKFGEEYSEEDDNLIIIPEDEGVIDLTWLMYEFIDLAIPMKHVHPQGQCNAEMAAKLNEILRVSPSDEDDMSEDELEAEHSSNETDAPIDPRWNELKKIIDNN